MADMTDDEEQVEYPELVILDDNLTELGLGGQDFVSEINDELSSDEIPTLVVERVIESLTDIQLLKKCRLVNKFWNQEASKAFRKLAVTNLSEELNGRWINFVDILNNPLALELPCPFKTFAVKCWGFWSDDFYDLVLRPTFEINSVSIGFEVHLQRLTKFMEIKKANITELNFMTPLQNSYHFQLPDFCKLFTQVRLPSLKCLSYGDICYTDSNILQIITEGVALSALKIEHPHRYNCPPCTCYASFSLINVSRLEKLELENIGQDWWKTLAEVRLPALKILTITPTPERRRNFNNNSTFIEALFKNIAPSIEKLQHNLYQDQVNCTFQKLKYIRLDRTSTAFLQQITHENFPYLEELHTGSCNINHMFGNELLPHEGVQIFSVETYSLNVSEEPGHLLESIKSFESFMLYLTRKFPHIKDFRFTIYGNVVCRHLRCIYNAYPHLKAITIFERNNGQPSLRNDLCGLVQKSSGTSSLLDFQNLESISLLFRKTLISDDMIRDLLSLLLKLKHAKFPWNANLSVEVVGTYLQHLEKLEICKIDAGPGNSSSCPGFELDVVLRQLQLALPKCSVTKFNDVPLERVARISHLPISFYSNYH